MDGIFFPYLNGQFKIDFALKKRFEKRISKSEKEMVFFLNFPFE